MADALLVFEQDRVMYYPFGYRHYLYQLKRAEMYEQLKEAKADEQPETGDAESESGEMGSAESGSAQSDNRTGGLMGIAMRAEDRALVDDMRRVPEAEKGRFLTISTEQAYHEWRMRLMGEELDRLAERTMDIAAKKEEQEQKHTAAVLGYEKDTDPGERNKGEDFADTLSDALQQAEGEWTRICIAWDEEFAD